MVECQLPKLEVAGSNPVSRSTQKPFVEIILQKAFFVQYIQQSFGTRVIHGVVLNFRKNIFT